MKRSFDLANFFLDRPLPYERITIEYVQPGTKWHSVVSENTSAPRYAINWSSAFDLSIHPPTVDSLSLMAHELQHIKDLEAHGRNGCMQMYWENPETFESRPYSVQADVKAEVANRPMSCL